MRAKKNEWIDYLFQDDESGEYFFVETDQGEDAAWDIATQYFKEENIGLADEMTPEEASFYGYDTY